MMKKTNSLFGVLLSVQLALSPVAYANPQAAAQAQPDDTAAIEATVEAARNAEGGNVGDSPAEKESFFAKVKTWFQNVKSGVGDSDSLQRQQADWAKKNRSLPEKANPFKDPNAFKSEDEVVRFLDESSSQRYVYSVDRNTNVVTVYDTTKQTDPIAGYFQLSTPKELHEYSPARFKEKLVNAAKAAGKAGYAGAHHTAVNMPFEASVFYVAMGAVSAFYMFNNFGQNPAGIKIFNDQQLSVLGGSSLFMFLATQNMTSNIAQLAIKNRNWHVLLPYLGMTVGTMAQNYWMGLWTDPNVKACINTWFGQVSKVEGAYEDPCEKAYDYFTLQKPWEFAPGLTSMMISTVASAVGGHYIAKGVLRAEKAITEKVITSAARRQAAKIALVRFAGVINPAATPFLVASGAWLFLTKASNLAVFASIDHAITHKIMFATKNLQEGVSVPFLKTIQRTSEELTQQIAYQKENGWNVKPTEKACSKNKHADCSGFYEELNRFTDQMKNWRMANMADIMEAHNSWQTYLGKLVVNYNTSKEFYQTFIDQSRHLVNLSEDPSEEKLLTRYYPLWGIKTTGVKEIDSTFFTDPHLPESEQMIPVKEFQREILAHVASQLQRNVGWRDDEVQFFAAVNKYFLNNKGETPEDQLNLGRGIEATQKYLERKKIAQQQFYTSYIEVSKMIAKLGNSKPKLFRGQGMIAALERVPSIAASYKDLEPPPSRTLIKYNSMSDFYLMSMLCGPNVEKGEQLITSAWGYPAQFTPPAITNIRQEVKNANNFCWGLGTGEPELLYTSKLIGPWRWTKDQRWATYNGPFDYLKFNLKQELLGPAQNKPFEKWWKTHTEAQMTKSFQSFQEMYKNNMAKMVERLHQKEFSKWNLAKTAANGVMQSVFQELRVNLLILGEILKDSYALKNGKLLPEEFLSKESVPNYVLRDSLDSKVPEVLRAQAYGSYLDFDSIARNYPAFGYRPKVQNSGGRVLKIQKDMELIFMRMNGLLRKMQAVKNSQGNYEITGNVNNFDLQKLTEETEKMAEVFSKLLGVYTPPKTSSQLFQLPKNDPKVPEVAGQAETRTESLVLTSEKVTVAAVPNFADFMAKNGSAGGQETSTAPDQQGSSASATNTVPSNSSDDDDNTGDNPVLMIASGPSTQGANATPLAQNQTANADDEEATAGQAQSAVGTNAAPAQAAAVEIQKLVDLSPGSKAIAVKCLENIQALAYEVMSYGMIINAVSWENLQRIKEMSESQQEQQRKVQEKIDSAKLKTGSISSK